MADMVISSQVDEKLQAGKRLHFDEGMYLFNDMDLFDLGYLADQASLSRVGPNVVYRLNRHIHYTNICHVRCSFCGFSRNAGDEDAFCLTIDQVIEQVRQACKEGAGELHVVGGINPQCDWYYYLNMVRSIREAAGGVRIKAFTATEIIHMADQAGKSVEYILRALMEAGLNSLPGGGAEILDERYFKQVCPSKSKPAQWLDVHATAHRLGLMTNATMLFGYRETLGQILHHLFCLRTLQDESIRQGRGRFECFVPLPYVRPFSDGASRPAPVNIDVELRIIALSRLMLDNFDHIKAFWPMLGVECAQMALCFGANDLDGTVGDYGITPSRFGRAEQGLTEQRIRKLVGEIGKTAVRCG